MNQLVPSSHLLSILILLPLAGAAFLMLWNCGEKTSRSIALTTTLVTLLFSIPLWTGFDNGTAAFQFEEKYPWFVGYNISIHLGIDGISLFMVMLTTFLMPLCILCSWEAIKKRVREFMIAFLVLESFVIGVFSSLDLLLFYIFFEGMLIPMYLIIGVWGGDRRVYAAYKFFLYTLLGSVLLLLAVLYIFQTQHTTDIPALMISVPKYSLEIQRLLWLAMFASFAVKVPMWPFHTWLPDAHVQAPTAGSVILAGILLKMGAYGYLRFSLPMLPEASHAFAPLVFGLSVIAVVYTSLIALVQQDMKKLIAYSSVAHMGFVTAGMFTFTQQGIEGSIIQMISHGVVSGALFLCVGVVYDRLHTREIARYGGLANIMPYYALAFLFFTMASAGLPSTSGFVGEFLVIIGAYSVSAKLATLIATGMVLGAAYALWLYRRVVFGELVKADLMAMKDLSIREWLIFIPLAVMVLWLGIYPSSFLNAIHASVEHLILQTK